MKLESMKHIRLSKKMSDRLKIESEKTGDSESEIIRIAVQKYLKIK